MKITNAIELFQKLNDLIFRANRMELKHESNLGVILSEACYNLRKEELSLEQIKCLLESIKTLTNKWGELKKSDIKEIKNNFLNLNIEFRWLPDHYKRSQRDIESIKSVIKKVENNITRL